MFAYCLNNPVMYKDVLGSIALPVFGASASLAGPIKFTWSTISAAAISKAVPLTLITALAVGAVIVAFDISIPPLTFPTTSSTSSEISNISEASNIVASREPMDMTYAIYEQIKNKNRFDKIYYGVSLQGRGNTIIVDLSKPYTYSQAEALLQSGFTVDFWTPTDYLAQKLSKCIGGFYYGPENNSCSAAWHYHPAVKISGMKSRKSGHIFFDYVNVKYIY